MMDITFITEALDMFGPVLLVISTFVMIYSASELGKELAYWIYGNDNDDCVNDE